jgi:ubiquinone/menaquinone biosynthesis C-methylase UbiE
MDDSTFFQEMARQLRHPQGEQGLETAEMMHASNIGMTQHAIRCLGICAGDHILELGHGGGKHIGQVMAQGEGLIYHGLEISDLMSEQARQNNQALADQKQAFFHQYDGQTIPFPEHSFERIFTVNTIYFWEDPVQLLSELQRVLKPGGTLCITFAQESFMKGLPFTPFGFQLYDNERIGRLIASSTLCQAGSETRTETVTSKTGESVERTFTTVILKKDG